MLGPSDTARIVIVDADAVRCALRVEQLAWRGFSVSAGSLDDLEAIDAAVVVVDEPGMLEPALAARENGIVVVLCGSLDAVGLQRALHAGVTAWVDKDATVQDLTEHLYRGLDRVRAGTLGHVTQAAVQEMPIPVVITDANGRVLAASRTLSGAHPGHDAQAIIDGGDWHDCVLGEGARLYAGLSEAQGVDPDASVHLAQVAAFTGEAQHEMNNFATYVLANLGALLDEDWAVPPSREDQLEMLREAHEGARGMVDIIRRLRVAIHAEAAPRLGGVDLGELVRAEARGLGGPVSVSGPRAMTVQADAPRLARAVSMLMTAARTHGDGDVVTVALEVERDTVVIRIAGGGPGFDRVAGRGLFASFLKVEGRDAPAADSLSLVTAIAAEHGGSACVRDHADGRRWFVMDLPLDGGVPL